MSAAQIKALARVTMAQFAILADEAISADPSLRGEKLSAALMAKLDEPAPTTTIDEKPTKIIDEATSDTTTVAASFGAASSYTLVESTSTNFRKFKFQLPYLPDHVSYGGCQMLKLAGGLWVPCGTTCPKDSHDDKCKSCSKSEDDHLPHVSDRVTWSSEHPNEPFQVTMPDGKVKKETTYATFCAKKGIDIRDVQNEWSRVFPTAKPLEFAKYHLEVNASSVKQLEAVRRSREKKKKNGDASSDDGSHETPKRGRPPKAKTADDLEVKPKRKPGRPKKDSSEAAKIEVEQSALEAAFDEVEDNATAESSHSSVAADTNVSEEPVSTLVEKIDNVIREQQENSDADKAKKASEKAENEAKKAAEKAAKEAKKAAVKAEKEAKKAAEKAEKEAKKAMAKAEKEAKKAEKEAKKAEKEAKKVEKEAKKAEKEAKKAEKEAKKEAPLPPASTATPLPPAPPALNEEMNAMKDEIYSCIPFIESGTGKSAAVKAMLSNAKTIDDLKTVRDMVSDEISTMKKSKKDSVEPSTPPSTPPSMASSISEKEDGEISEHSDSEDEQGTVRVLTKSNGEEITVLDVNGVLYNQTTFDMVGSYDETTNTADFIDES
jgi:hypothetical protein